MERLLTIKGYLYVSNTEPSSTTSFLLLCWLDRLVLLYNLVDQLKAQINLPLAAQ